MPIYPFKCPTCGAIEDIVCKYSELETIPPPKCEKCEGKVMQKVFTSAATHFKGPGFYETTYKRKT